MESYENPVAVAEINKDNKENMKPSVLYHASQNRDIDLLEPRTESVRDTNEGPVVFATPDKAEAVKFIVPSNDTWTKKMRYGEIHIHIISDRKRYEEADKGGVVYHLNPETFENDETKGSKTEWTSKTPVKPYEKEIYESGLQAQLENGVQVYFTDKETFKKIEESEDHGNSIIRNLISENKVRNINPKEVPNVSS